MNPYAPAVLACTILLGCATTAPTAPVAPPSTMRVYFIDVGQGAATLFEFDDGAVLVDTGGEDNESVHSNDLLAAYLTAFFERRKDLHGRLASLVLTHPHLDHTRGVGVVLERFTPRNVVTNGQTQGSGAQQQVELQQWAGEHPEVGIRAIRMEEIPTRGLTDQVIDPVRGSDVDPVLTVLWGQVATDPGWGEAYNKPRFTNQNNHSIVLRVDFGKASVLVTDDLEEPAIKDLVRRYQGTGLLDVDVYEVGHHGSINGTIPELVAAMSPEMAVIECGRPDHEAQYCAWAFGHPRQEVVAILEAGIATPRRPVTVRIGTGAKAFVDRTVTRAVYATGWEGTIVAEFGASGAMHLVQEYGRPKPYPHGARPRRFYTGSWSWTRLQACSLTPAGPPARIARHATTRRSPMPGSISNDRLHDPSRVGCPIPTRSMQRTVGNRAWSPRASTRGRADPFVLTRSLST